MKLSHNQVRNISQNARKEVRRLKAKKTVSPESVNTASIILAALDEFGKLSMEEIEEVTDLVNQYRED